MTMIVSEASLDTKKGAEMIKATRHIPVLTVPAVFWRRLHLTHADTDVCLLYNEMLVCEMLEKRGL